MLAGSWFVSYMYRCAGGLFVSYTYRYHGGRSVDTLLGFSDVQAHMALHRHIDLLVGPPLGHDWR